MRDRVVTMMRIRNEERWIARSLERTWCVSGTVAIWDDGSEDGTEAACRASLGPDAVFEPVPWGWVGRSSDKTLRFYHSPFRGRARAKERVSEIRDKNCLWYAVKADIDCDHVLCLDGDEMLSLQAVRLFPKLIQLLDQPQGPNMLQLPFIYVWDREDTQRVDGIYGNAADGFKTLRFPRVFTLRGVDEQALFDMHFNWRGSRGGFHCGSVPQDGFRPYDQPPTPAFVDAPVVHFGYLEAERRQAKFTFYNIIDPGNEYEGGYLHIIGQPNRHAPGPIQLAPWTDH